MAQRRRPSSPLAAVGRQFAREWRGFFECDLISNVPARKLWHPTWMHHLPGLTPEMWAELSGREMIDSRRFVMQASGQL